MKEIEQTVKLSRKTNMLYNNNPMDELLEQKLVIPVGIGLFVFNGILAQILEKIDHVFKKIAEKVDAKAISVPSLLSWENTQKSQYLNSFRNQAISLYTLHENTAEPSPNECIGLSSPTVCYHYFSSLQNSTITNNHLITAISKCARKEQGPLPDFSRCTNFTMREVVILGTEQFCQEKRDEILQQTLDSLNTFFDLDYSLVTASDPFFGNQSELKAKAQLFSQAKYEIQATIPWNKSSISIASFNNHGKIFYSRFSISSQEPQLSHSSCIGWGYERILYAIVAQKGLNFNSPYYTNLLKKEES